jgi:hypothetical protein
MHPTPNDPMFRCCVIMPVIFVLAGGNSSRKIKTSKHGDLHQLGAMRSQFNSSHEFLQVDLGVEGSSLQRQAVTCKSNV